MAKEWVYKFLLGLSLYKVRERILSTKPFPSLHELFSVDHEVRKKKLMLNNPWILIPWRRLPWLPMGLPLLLMIMKRGGLGVNIFGLAM